VEPSEEIRSVIRRFTNAVEEGDGDSALSRLSDDAGMVLIGTDPTEWWHGPDARAMWAYQLDKIGGSFPVTAEEIEAWEEGTVGWATVKEAINWAGKTLESRATYVLHLEHGEWKIVHVHWSLPKRHIDAYGEELNLTLEELERAVQEARPDLSTSVAADGTVTIVFTDIVDSTVTLSRLGDTAWVEMIRRHNKLLEQVTEAYGGTVVKMQGDGSMLSFASARRAVSCAQEIQQSIGRAFVDVSPPIRVRIGVHTGEAIQEADDFFGTTVHYAARVASQALGGEILVSAIVRDLVAGHSSLSFIESRGVELKGFEGRHRLFALAPPSLPVPGEATSTV
jgi:class 3 adenylate cyclase/ketosteroid isomerase-like protein